MFDVNTEDKASATAQLLIHRPGEWFTFDNGFGKNTIHTALIKTVSDSHLCLHFSDGHYSINKEIHEQLIAILKKYNTVTSP